MQIMTPKHYDVCFDNEEQAILIQAYGIIDSLLNEMDDYNCDICSCDDGEEMIDKDELEEVLKQICKIQNIDKFFKENQEKA